MPVPQPLHLRSKPTVWDGDFKKQEFSFYRVLRSKPTVWDGDVRLLLSFLGNIHCSKPTVWDGDLADLAEEDHFRDVLSPPCGMETLDTRSHLVLSNQVLSPPCGMETFCTFVRKMFFFWVLSPPCGMETYFLHFHLSQWKRRSKPTVWDGDFLLRTGLNG